MVRPAARLALLLLLPLAAACDRAAGGSARGAAPPPTVPEDGGTVVIGVIADPDNLLDVTCTSLSGQEIVERMFLSLVDVGEDYLSFEPSLARSWEEGEDGKSITFHLAPEARWHDGEPVTARDVRFTHDLQTDPVVGYSARSWKEFITEVVVEDDHTVTYRFDRDYPYQLMDANVGAVLPEHLLRDVPRARLSSCEFARSPVGNGPFRFSRWNAMDSVELVANEGFFLGRPHLDRVIFRTVPEKTSLVVMLESGDVDVMEDVPPHEVARLEQSGRDIRIERFPGRGYTYIGWDSTNPLFASARVRRALGMAIDRDAIIAALCHGFARPCLGPIHPILWAYDETLPPLPHDPDGARAILAEEGWTDTDGDGWLDRGGEPFAFELKTNEGNQLREDAAVMIQAQLARVGVRVTPRTYEWTVLWDSVIKHSYGTAVLVGWNVALKVDLKPEFHSESLTGKFNHTGYSDPEVDALIDRALAAPSLEEARPVWHEVQRRIVEDQPYTFLFIPERIYGVNGRVRGTAPDTRGYYRSLQDWWIPASERRQRAGV
jgi:peptide/nickel transport system substrate-binding protein